MFTVDKRDVVDHHHNLAKAVFITRTGPPGYPALVVLDERETYALMRALCAFHGHTERLKEWRARVVMDSVLEERWYDGWRNTFGPEPLLAELDELIAILDGRHPSG